MKVLLPFSPLAAGPEERPREQIGIPQEAVFLNTDIQRAIAIEVASQLCAMGIVLNRVCRERLEAILKVGQP
jgi:hypothetical protein